MPTKVGAASRVINNELGTVIQGATVDQVVSRIRDDLEAGQTRSIINLHKREPAL